MTNIRLAIILFTLIGLHPAIAQVNFILTNSPSVGKWPKSIVAADVGSDGKIDLISANQIDNTLTVLTNAGGGIFRSNATYTVGTSPRAVVAADVTGDGKIDLISANGSGNTLSILTNNGNGTFTLASSPSAGVGAVSVVAADVNGDGKIDLITANGNSPTLSVFTNKGNGIFVSNATYSVTGAGGNYAVSVTAADVNGDGKVDLICANAGSLGQFASFSVLTNDGKGKFPTVVTYSVASSPSFIIAADVNGDGKPDLAYVNENKYTSDGMQTGFDNTLTIWTNNGSGGFSSNATYTVGSGPSSIVAADVNGDGKVDLITANYASASLSILTNSGSGGFALASSLGTGVQPWSVVAADVNNDGKLDLICGNNTYQPIVSGTLSVFINNSIFPTPTLIAKQSGNNLLISWPSSWTNWTLLQNTNLAMTNWTIFSGVISNDGTNKNATNSLTTGNKYFRLSHP